jgi:hypothetical protein
MAKSHLLALPEQELVVLLRAAQNPAFAALFAQTPAFRAALDTPVDNFLLSVAEDARKAISEVTRNTSHPEDWLEARGRAGRMITQRLAQAEAQRAACSKPAVEADSTTSSCPPRGEEGLL